MPEADPPGRTQRTYNYYLCYMIITSPRCISKGFNNSSSLRFKSTTILGSVSYASPDNQGNADYTIDGEI